MFKIYFIYLKYNYIEISIFLIIFTIFVSECVYSITNRFWLLFYSINKYIFAYSIIVKY
jgi:hypothetical protein